MASVSTLAANQPNEDRFVVFHDTSCDIYAVLDGHGGDQCAHTVAERLPELFLEAWKEHPRDVRMALHRAFRKADSDYLDRYPHIQDGCCCCLVVVTTRFLHVANVGDCRALLVTQDSEGDWTVKAVSHDHAQGLDQN